MTLPAVVANPTNDVESAPVVTIPVGKVTLMLAIPTPPVVTPIFSP